MSDTPVQTGSREWFVVDDKGHRQHDGMITEAQADAMLRKLLTESDQAAGKSYQKKQYLKG